MKLKTILAKFLTLESKLGSHVFKNVPVDVEETIDAKTFDPSENDYYLSSDVIDESSRILAQNWLNDYMKSTADGNHRRRHHLSTNEVQGIMLVCDINASELATILDLSKPQVSKILNEKDGQTLKGTAVTLLIFLLDRELKAAGIVRRMVKKSDLGLRPREVVFDLKKLA